MQQWTSSGGRIFSLDVLRGLATALMIVVDAPPGPFYSTLKHSAWEGLTLADWAFPAFVFAMGASAAVSLIKRGNFPTKKIFTRAVILFLIGLILNARFDFFAYLLQENFTSADLFDKVISHGGVFGILQRLALTYALGMIIIKVVRSDKAVFAAALLLLVVSSIGFHAYAPAAPFAQENNISVAADEMLIGRAHMYFYEPYADPEGIYGTMASAATMLFGFLAGRVLADSAFVRDKINVLIFVGMILLILGGFWSFADIISKKLWTAPFALLMSGCNMILLAIFLQIFERRQRAKKIFQPFSAFGKNPLFFFLASNIVVAFLCRMPSPVEGVAVWGWAWQTTLRGFFSDEFSAMIFCIIWCLLWLPLAELFDRLDVVIKL